ncbi:MAG: PadR family transcriptional regulator [Planctomycetota bacterium]
MTAHQGKSSHDWANCPCSGGTLDRLIRPAILVVLAEGPVHGYRLADQIGQMPMFADAKPDGSGVYRFLKTMEGEGLVTSSWDTSQSGPARKTYEITDAGKDCLREWVKTLEDYRTGLNALLKAARKATE